MNTTLELNDAQRLAVEHGDGALLVVAGAGSGKTRVLTARVAALLERGVPPEGVLAFTFTNRAAREMRERIERATGRAIASRVWVGTFHATGVRILRRESRRGVVGVPPEFTIYDREDQETLLREVQRTLALPEGTFRMGQLIGKISDAKNALVTPEEAERAAVSPYERRVAEAYAAYQRGLRERGALDFDDLIAQVVILFRTHPDVAESYGRRFQHVLVDEYQDTNHAQFRLVSALAGVHGNLFVVGDDDQCLAAGTLVTMGDGTLRPIEQIRPGDSVRSGQGSGRFRTAEVLRVHEKAGIREGVEIVTRGGRRIVSTPEHTHFAGYVAGVSPQTHFTYLMFRRGVGYRLGTTQVYTRGQKQPTLGFMLRLAQEHGDALWIVGAHVTEQEARLDEYVLSLRYRIPTLPFVPRKLAGTRQAGLVHDPDMLARVFAEFGAEEPASQLLADRGLSLEVPHYSPRSRNSNRRNVIVTLCGDARGARPMHRISMVGNDEDGRHALEEIGLSIRPAKAGSRSWRHETANTSYLRLQATVQHIATRFPVHVHQMARLGRSGVGRQTNSLPFLPAGSVQPGMAMFDELGGFDVVASVRRVGLSGPVYDLDVEHTHNYVANGLLTHNSIYGWRGADLTHVLDFETTFPGASVIRLEQNYRSTGNILQAANAVISNNQARKGKTLWSAREAGARLRFVLAQDDVDEARTVRRFLDDRRRRGLRLDSAAVLYRTHAQSRALETDLRQNGFRYEIVGGISFYQRREVKDLLAYLRVAVNPADAVAFWRIWNTPRRGLGDAVRARLEARLEAGAATPEQALRAELSEGGLARAARSGAEALLGLIDRLRERLADPVELLLARILDDTEYLGELGEAGDAEGEERRANVEELLAGAAQFSAGREDGDARSFLAEAALLTDVDRLEEGVDRVLLLTAHNAKGLEFDAVIVAGLEEGLFPHGSSLDDPKELEEERRLFYVALTRARDEVLLTAAAYRRRFDGSSGGGVSRFIDEIPNELLAREDTSVRPASARRAGWSDPAKAAPVYRTSGVLGRMVGREVHHETFGRGVVVAVEQEGRDRKFTVRFGTQIKKVLGRYLSGDEHED